MRLRVIASRVLAATTTGDFENARESAQAGLAEAEQIGLETWVGRFRVWSGMVAHMRGELPEAVRLGLLGLEQALRTHDDFMIVAASMLLMPLRDRLPRKGAELPPSDELLDVAERVGHATMLAGLRPMLAIDALVAGDMATAAARCSDSLRMVRPYPASPFAVYALMCATQIAHAAGNCERVAQFHGLVRNEIPIVAPTMPPSYVRRQERAVESAERALGVQEFELIAARSAAAGRENRVDDALAWVDHLAQTTPDRPPDRAHLRGRRDDGALSKRQDEVLVLMASGFSDKDIAGRLGIRHKTVEHHASVIYRKLGVRGRTEATAWAHRHGRVGS
jgi:DNA-binding CsgD family transcriptional regulator